MRLQQFAVSRTIKAKLIKNEWRENSLSHRCFSRGQGDERISNREFASIFVLACNLAVDILLNAIGSRCLSLADLPSISNGTRPRIRRSPPPLHRLFLCCFNFVPFDQTFRSKRIKRQCDSIQDRDLECLPLIEEISSVILTMLSVNTQKILGSTRYEFIFRVMLN